jgi:hypothetical protein
MRIKLNFLTLYKMNLANSKLWHKNFPEICFVIKKQEKSQEV